MFNNLGDADQGLKGMQKAIRRIHPNAGGGGDGAHSGSGAYSLLLGAGSSFADASGDYAVALGPDAIASDFHATAVGFGAEATADHATAVGFGASASANYSSGFGRNAAASGAYSSAIGSGAAASGSGASAVGAESIAAHDNSTALGNSAETTADDQVMLGADWQSVVVPGTFQVSSTPPASSSAAGVAGQFTWASGYLYICVSANSWRRVALSTF